MEVKEMLENYNNYLAEIKTKEYAIKKLELEEVSVSGSNFTVNGDIRPKGYMSSNTERKVINNTDKIAKLRKEIEELKEKVEMLNSLLNILKYKEKEILKLKYKDKKTDAEIAEEKKIAERTVRDNVKRSIIKMNSIFKIKCKRL